MSGVIQRFRGNWMLGKRRAMCLRRFETKYFGGEACSVGEIFDGGGVLRPPAARLVGSHSTSCISRALTPIGLPDRSSGTKCPDARRSGRDRRNIYLEQPPLISGFVNWWVDRVRRFTSRSARASLSEVESALSPPDRHASAAAPSAAGAAMFSALVFFMWCFL